MIIGTTKLTRRTEIIHARETAAARDNRLRCACSQDLRDKRLALIAKIEKLDADLEREMLVAHHRDPDHKVMTCIHCGAEIPLELAETIPGYWALDDWDKLAPGHAPDCEWIKTRAFSSESANAL